MNFLLGKLLIAGIFTICSSVALAEVIQTGDLQFYTDTQIVISNNDLSYFGWGVADSGTILLLSLGLFGLILARRRSL